MGAVLQELLHCSYLAAGKRNKIYFSKTEILNESTKKMSYYRLKADFENTFQSGRSHRSRSLPRETFSHDPYLPFTRAASVPPSDYLETSRSRFARNLRPNWYSYCQEPSYDYYSPRYSYYDNIYYGNNPRDLYYDRYSNYYDSPSSYFQSSRYLRPRNLAYDYHDYLYPSIMMIPTIATTNRAMMQPLPMKVPTTTTITMRR